MAHAPLAKRTSLYAIIGLLVCGFAGYFIAGSEGRNTGSLVGAIAGVIVSTCVKPRQT